MSRVGSAGNWAIGQLVVIDRDDVEYRLRPALANAELNALFSLGRPAWQTAPDTSDWQPVLEHSLVYIGAFLEGDLVGFVNVAWDGRDHAFLLDPRVHPDWRQRGVGRELVRRAAEATRAAGVASGRTSTTRRNWRRSTRRAASSRRRRA